jgi:DNA polymerase III epsilon subunit-like protein
MKTENAICLDIETAPRPIEELKAIMPKFDAPANWVDQKKIAACIEEKEATWLADAAKRPKTGRIIMIGLLWVATGESLILDEMMPQKSKVPVNPERLMLSMMFELFLKQHPYQLIGHNINGFDIPFIRGRAFVHGLRQPWSLRGKYLQDPAIDTMTEWMGGTEDRISLDDLCSVLGIPMKKPREENGEKFLPFKGWPGNRDKSIEYLLNDLRMTAACAQKMGLCGGDQ